MEIGEWVICPHCHVELIEKISLGHFTTHRCDACHRHFRVYTGNALWFTRKRQPGFATYHLLLSGSPIPKFFILRDETQDEVIIDRGDRVVVGYRGDRPIIIQDLSAATYWVVHDMTPLGCFASLATLLMSAVAIVAFAILTAK